MLRSIIQLFLVFCISNCTQALTAQLKLWAYVTFCYKTKPVQMVV